MKPIKRKKKDNSFDNERDLGKGFKPLSSQFGIPGTSYRVQLGLINGKFATRLLKGKSVIDSYIFKDEDISESGIPNQNLLVGWVLRTAAIPNINPDQVMKIIQALVKQALRKKQDQGDEDDDNLPYPYICKPPKPPGDPAMAPQVQVHAPLKEIDHQDEIYCQYCGRKLTKEEQITHSCKKKPE